ncbi:uncharacterized protein LOC131665273 [Phymastichus coffea]|uniref:uncharacterized protein LOC131665273 n=1 Tax=Phymastichus coffea TaxID=108790 RepID=UPI00273CA4C3|nr:uncharacterized protein LOC131665273 [Phymastichus coffea]
MDWYSCFMFPGKIDTHLDKNHSMIPWNAFVSCLEIQRNGSLVYLECRNISRESAEDQCDNVFTIVEIYGAKMMIFANIIYLFFYAPMFLLYIIIPKMCRRAYDKAVLTFITVQVLLSFIIITIGHYILCHKHLGRLAISLLGISLMTLTVASCCWLLVISFDVASTITKFRWAPASGVKGLDENRKFRIYSLWVSIGTFVPAIFSTILQFSPIPDEHFIKPNFHNMSTVNYRVVIHTAIVPVLVAIASNVLFIVSTIKMINIQKSTSVANENRKARVKKKYILYLKLYLLMVAPYLTGVLGSSFENLWILKFIRIVQPMFLCHAVIPRSMLVNLFACRRKKQEITSKPTKARGIGA